MAWTTPRTWVDGETPSASVMNTHIRDNVRMLPGYVSGGSFKESILEATGANEVGFVDPAAALFGGVVKAGSSSVETGAVAKQVGWDDNTIYTSNVTINTGSFQELTKTCTVEIAHGSRLLVFFGLGYANSPLGDAAVYVSPAVANNSAASSAYCVMYRDTDSGNPITGSTASAHLFTGLTPGTNEVSLQFLATVSSDWRVNYPFLVAIAL